MKMRSLNFLVVAELSISLFKLGWTKEGAIQGKLTPVYNVKEVVAIAGTDALKSLIENGEFVFSNFK